MKYSKIAQELCSHPWAITEAKLDTIVGVLLLKESGGGISADVRERIVAEAEERKANLQRNAGKIGVMGIYGTLSHRPSIFSSGGLSAMEIREKAKALAADEDIAEVVLDIDSQGGSVFGLPEAAKALYDLRKVKPVTAVVNANAHSAAYFLASQANEIVSTESGYTGSIGVILPVVDDSEEDANVTYIKAGKYKAEGYEAPTEEYTEHMQGIVDKFYSQFVGAVARGRGIDASTVEANFGQGRSFLAEEAKERGMIDRISSFDEVIEDKLNKLKSKRDRNRRMRSALI
jgi:signal peptide peptidase SppA